jgi:hypothetical protein
MEAARIVIDMGDPQVLASEIPVRHASREELAGGGETVELQREFGTLISHAV